MKQLTKFNNRGFTIVETLIVLAIAAVIIIIVLLAVPALQRTTRNTDIKNDAAAVAGAINDYESNNGGTKPVGFLQSTSSVQFCNLAACASGSTVGSTATVQSSDVIQLVATSGTTPTQASVKAGTIQIDLGNATTGYSCLNTTGPFTAAQLNTTAGTGSGNQVPVYYPDETGGTNNLLCIQA
jgi:prepilin-type N-terminal cleavage/methylation domain-containing protein